MMLVLTNARKASALVTRRPSRGGGERKRVVFGRAPGWQPRGTRLVRRSSSSSGASGGGVLLSVTRTFDTLQNPAVHNITYSGALEAFVGAAVLAYECGCSHAMLKEEILQSRRDSGSATGPSHQQQQEEDEFEGLTEVGLVWLVLSNIKAAKSKRWSTAPAVSNDFEKRWHGFVTLLLNAYFDHRMA